MERKKELLNLFKDVDENQRKLIDRLIDEVVHIEKELDYLKSLPPIRVHPADRSRQEITPAGKLYKDMAAQYMNAIRILCSLLNKVSGDDYDPVAEFMEQMRHGGSNNSVMADIKSGKGLKPLEAR